MWIKILIFIVIGAAAGALLGYFGQCSTGSCSLTANPLRGAIYGAAMGTLLAFSFRVPLIIAFEARAKDFFGRQGTKNAVY